MDTQEDQSRHAVVVVAHPDDETLWAGGFILLHPAWRWRVVALCRASDTDRAPRFRRALARFGATGAMADLDDGPEQRPLPVEAVQRAVLDLVDGPSDFVFTHGPRGEYTRHLRHEEVSAAVAALWEAGALQARVLCQFAYEDGGGAHLPRPALNASHRVTLPPAVWEEKRRIIGEIYGFRPDSWEWRTTPATESFFCLSSGAELTLPLEEVGSHREGTGVV